MTMDSEPLVASLLYLFPKFSWKIIILFKFCELQRQTTDHSRKW